MTVQTSLWSFLASAGGATSFSPTGCLPESLPTHQQIKRVSSAGQWPHPAPGFASFCSRVEGESLGGWPPPKTLFPWACLFPASKLLPLPFVPPLPPHAMMVLPGDKTHPLAPRTEAATCKASGAPHMAPSVSPVCDPGCREGTRGPAAAPSRGLLPAGQPSCQHSPAPGGRSEALPGRSGRGHCAPETLRQTQAGGGQAAFPALPLSIPGPPCLKIRSCNWREPAGRREGPAAGARFSEGWAAAAAGPEPAGWACTAGRAAAGAGPSHKGIPKAGTSRSGASL